MCESPTATSVHWGLFAAGSACNNWEAFSRLRSLTSIFTRHLFLPYLEELVVSLLLRVISALYFARTSMAKASVLLEKRHFVKRLALPYSLRSTFRILYCHMAKLGEPRLTQSLLQEQAQ